MIYSIINADIAILNELIYSIINADIAILNELQTNLLPIACLHQ